MKDYITIKNNLNETRTVEVIAKYTMEDSPYNYIIYKELDNSHHYIAKYQGESIVYLDTNLTAKELAFANIIYRGVN